jgi:broad specificity phosphatase PhoE
MALDPRCVFVVPPADTDEEGELSALGVRQSRALGDAFGDIPLRAVYAGPGLAAEDTAANVSQRHGLVVRRKPALDFAVGERFDVATERVVEAFELIARAGPGRTSLLVIPLPAARIILSHCSGVAPSLHDTLALPPASVTEITVEETQYVLERLGDTSHLTYLLFDR